MEGRVQVTAEGGLEAAMEAPYVYKALDSLALRAASWAERAQRHQLDSSPPSLAASLPDPQEAGAAMAAAVKKVRRFTFVAHVVAGSIPCLNSPFPPSSPFFLFGEGGKWEGDMAHLVIMGNL
jgi:hypothetical protein